VSVKLGKSLPPTIVWTGFIQLSAQVMQDVSRYPTSFRSRLSGDAWLFPSFWGRLSRFGWSSFRRFGSFRSRLSGGAWLSPSCCGRVSRFGWSSFPRFGYDFNRSRQF
jgi:hypothetical protein